MLRAAGARRAHWHALNWLKHWVRAIWVVHDPQAVSGAASTAAVHPPPPHVLAQTLQMQLTSWAACCWAAVPLHSWP